VRVSFCTLGCKVNQYDTETMMSLFAEAGWDIVDFGQECEVSVINSCTVTATGDKKTRQMASRARAFSPEGIVMVAGCGAQKAAEAMLALPGVYVALGTKNRSIAPELAARAWETREKINAVGDIMTERVFEELPAMTDGRTRATLKIQDGCNRFCSYCIIPFARGPVRSRQPENVIKEVERLASAGFSEFVLTGIHLASYGSDIGTDLITMIEKVCAVEGVKRLRLGSLEPLILTDDFCARCAAQQKLCRQFHVSLQSGCDSVLARMNRRYLTHEYARGVQALRKVMPHCAVTTDMIAGFPGETEEEHRQTMEFVERIAFSRIHVFPYSRRPGTKAAQMPELPKAVKNRRAAELIELGRRLEHAYIDAALGSVQSVLLEQEDEAGRMTGYTGTYIHTAVHGGEQGSIVNVRLLRREGETAIGEIVQDGVAGNGNV
jgi:threonylcarbamoyladenosine tRNA methylthiotransferase MtaB